jgi:hypothetical protein
MKIFKDWGDICSLPKEDVVYDINDFRSYIDGGKKKRLYFAVVNEDYKADSSYLRPFSEHQSTSDCDFFDLSGNLLLYFRNNKRKNEEYKGAGLVNYTKPDYETFVFKKNKLYPFLLNCTWWDEFNQNMDQYNTIWYEPFQFVIDTDWLKAERQLKLKKIK